MKHRCGLPEAVARDMMSKSCLRYIRHGSHLCTCKQILTHAHAGTHAQLHVFIKSFLFFIRTGWKKGKSLLGKYELG